MLYTLCAGVALLFITGTYTQFLDTSKLVLPQKNWRKPIPGDNDTLGTKDPLNPCRRKPISLPKLDRRTTRISVIKCAEYIDELWKAAQSKVNLDHCNQYLKERGVFQGAFVGGRAALPGEFPHMVALGWKSFNNNWIFKCGGALISSKFVLTAAHCSQAAGDSNLVNQVPEIVRVGATQIHRSTVSQLSSDYPKDIPIRKIIVHPYFSPPRKYYDLALVEMTKDVEFSKTVFPACLWTSFNTKNIKTGVSAAGWGVTTPGSRTTSDDLQTGELDLFDLDLCGRLFEKSCYRLWCGIQPHQMCAGKLAGGVDSCQGDSGGPLQVILPLRKGFQQKLYYLLGVTSFGFGCARKNLPGIYTRVFTFIDWIEDIVWADEI